ncbi:hypothetical protein OIDMADRAFT_26212 [Oidiodendron maius Zn]|uniref:Uncharacterized protein n=1 Tax=Oidiodendron maius (strain Zn) TaxID=913774 RepID=A0A0C3HMF8_OIDMZ|nr:hypothetical protein OIDMADRAFT_26212 [Oidiodendron maius Zn]
MQYLFPHLLLLAVTDLYSRIKFLSGLALALATIVSAVPVAEPGALHKRDECVFYGEYIVEEIIGADPPLAYYYGYLYIQYEGGVNISPAIDGNQADSITEDPQTFTPSQTRLPNDITWYANFDLGYRSCTVEYEGTTYQGGPGNPGSQSVGTSAWICQVNFGCEGGISPLK